MVRFEFDGKLVGIKKINNEWAKLLFEGIDIPEEVSIHRDCIENNREILVACKKLPDNFIIHIVGKVYFRGGQWRFTASGVFEITPNPASMGPDELQHEIDSWFEEAKELSPIEQAKKQGLIPQKETP